MLMMNRFRGRVACGERQDLRPIASSAWENIENKTSETTDVKVCVYKVTERRAQRRQFAPPAISAGSPNRENYEKRRSWPNLRICRRTTAK
jgi:hypothetical protein